MLETEHKQIQHWLAIEDNQGKRTIVLEAATYSIGRDSSNSIALYSHLVSRQHAILLRVTQPETSSHVFRIIDGNLQGKPSTNGLTVNDQQCFSRELKHKDVIVFAGDVKARYYNNAGQPNLDLSTSDIVEDINGAGDNSSVPLSTAQSQLENATEALLVRLASFPELFSNPILEIDLTGAITYLNPAAVLQFPNIQEVKLQHPILAGLVEAVETFQQKFFVREVEVADKIVEQSVHYIAESDLIRSYIVDITERKRTEAALRESEAKNRALLNAIPDLILRMNKGGTYLDCMPAKDIYSCAISSELVGKNVYDILQPAIAQQRMQYVQQAFATGETQIFEYVVAINGRVRQEEARIVVSGEDEVLAIVRDITDRKQVEALLQQAHDELELGVAQRTAELRAANEQLRREIVERKRVEEALRSSIATNRALLNAIPDSIFRISQDGTFINYKAAKENSLSPSANELVGKKLDEVLPPQLAQQMGEYVRQAWQTGDIQILEYQLQIDQNLVDFEARIVVNSEDEAIAIVRDITERKQAEADIRHALEKEKDLNELKSRFVSMTSHEFRTPLTTILSSAELLQDYHSVWNEQKTFKHLQRIQVSVKHMTGLLNDVLLIGKAEAGKLEFKPVPLDLIRFCRELVEEMQLTTEAHMIVFSAEGQCHNAYMDEKLLRHILYNLLSNAMKYSPQAHVVNFDLIINPQTAIFSIQDYGIGIPAIDQEQLFNNFYRASNVGAIAGTGLGLAIVKKSVDLHQGQVTVTSEVGGTTFTVTLPLHQ